ncbi:MAG: hypothetical protein LQ342_008572, partial [Letrouitia transgressa]
LFQLKRELEDEESLEDESLDDYIKRQNFDSYTLDKLDQRKERSEILDIFESGKPALKKLRKNQDLNEDEDKALEPFRNGRYADQELGGNKFAREYDRDHEHALKLLNKNASDLESLGVSHRDIALPSTEDPLSDLDSSYSDAESVSTESDQSKLFAKPDVKHAHDNLISAKDQVDMSQSANTSLDKVKNNEPLNRQDLDNLSQYCYPGQNEQLNTKLDNNVTDPNSMFPDPQDFVNQADQVNKESRQLFRTVAEEFTDLADRAVSPHTYVDQHNWDSTYVTPLSELESSEDPVDPSEPESSVGPAASGSSNDFLLSESSGEELLIAEEDSVESSSKKHKVEDDSHNDDGNSNNGDDNSDNGDDNSDNGDNNLENGDDNSDNVDDDSRNTNGGISKGDSDLGKSEFSISNQFLNSVLIRILDIILILIKAAFGDDELPFDDD